MTLVQNIIHTGRNSKNHPKDKEQEPTTTSDYAIAAPGREEKSKAAQPSPKKSNGTPVLLSPDTVATLDYARCALTRERRKATPPTQGTPPQEEEHCRVTSPRVEDDSAASPG